MKKDSMFLNHLEIANAYFERFHYRNELEKLFNDRRFSNSIREIYDSMSAVGSWDEFRINVILETKVAIYTSLEKASRLAGDRVDLSKCEAEIISRAKGVARRVAISGI